MASVQITESRGRTPSALGTLEQEGEERLPGTVEAEEAFRIEWTQHKVSIAMLGNEKMAARLSRWGIGPQIALGAVLYAAGAEAITHR